MLEDIIGFEDDDEDSSDDDDSNDDSDDEEDDEDSEEGNDSSDSDEEEDEDDDKPVTQKDIRGLKSALKKEREARKLAQRELRKLKAKPKVTKKANSDDSEEDKDQGPSEREVRLAARLRDQAVDQVITKFASKMNFVDIEDAINLVSRKDIDVNQDEDDPTDVIIDEETVEDALKDLIKRKKHLVQAPVSKVRSGSKVTGKNNGKKVTDKEALKKKYRALR
jgi:hypothetical protein